MGNVVEEVEKFEKVRLIDSSGNDLGEIDVPVYVMEHARIISVREGKVLEEVLKNMIHEGLSLLIEREKELKAEDSKSSSMVEFVFLDKETNEQFDSAFVPLEAFERIKKAAEISGETVEEFVIKSLLDESDDTLKGNEEQ